MVSAVAMHNLVIVIDVHVDHDEIDAPDSTYDKVSPETIKEQASLIARYQELDKKLGKYADWCRNQKGKPKPRRYQPLLDGARDEYMR